MQNLREYAPRRQMLWSVSVMNPDYLCTVLHYTVLSFYFVSHTETSDQFVNPSNMSRQVTWYFWHSAVPSILNISKQNRWPSENFLFLFFSQVMFLVMLQRFSGPVKLLRSRNSLQSSLLPCEKCIIWPHPFRLSLANNDWKFLAGGW